MTQIETYFVHFIEGDQKKRLVLSKAFYDNTVQELRSLLSPEEKELLEKFKVASRRNEFIAGRLLAKNSIAAIEDKLEPSVMNITHGIWGFPLLTTKEIQNMWISIAHSKAYVAAVVTETSRYPIGIDIEEISKENESSLAHFLASYEADLTLEKKHIYWAAKEAVAKALRTGFTIPEHLFEISEVNYSARMYTIKFKYLIRLQALAWIHNDVVTCIAYPTELEFRSIQKHNFSITNT
ncbi:4'-phosphopantetheinyl transferase superfamily protein [Flavobacteriaceae bacterium S356]|uniref:4'-phosphopantetheinyl transferase superfamily protein n=1 Tax=Asprobacillus argus TaxID=3076534 RepID=A0ABU3LB02_9FLAO|nr:4'-phosphopantetheinyl transferase superfamily protein [Flavobacteriaceae bacterium S356]